jgi:putative transposase
MVDHVRGAWQVSIRRACRALPVDRSTYHYRSKRTGQAVLMKQIKEIAETRVRYGYRRIHVLLRREGWLVNAKRVCRLYREMGLQLRNRSPKRRARLRGKTTPAKLKQPERSHKRRARLRGKTTATGGPRLGASSNQPRTLVIAG